MRTPDRRDALRVALAGGAAMLLPKAVVAQEAAFSLPKLPYSFDALEPHIDAKTMEIHWGRHHKAYVDNLNKALAGKAEWEKKTGGEPTGPLAKAIDAAFESFAKFQAKLTAAGMTRFGSGWAWLVSDDKGKLDVISTANQDSPLMMTPVLTPLLGVDVWEHAYYLKYQNKRADYLAAWFKTVDWKVVAERHAKSGK